MVQLLYGVAYMQHTKIVHKYRHLNEQWDFFGYFSLDMVNFIHAVKGSM